METKLDPRLLRLAQQEQLATHVRATYNTYLAACRTANAEAAAELRSFLRQALSALDPAYQAPDIVGQVGVARRYAPEAEPIPHELWAEAEAVLRPIRRRPEHVR